MTVQAAEPQRMDEVKRMSDIFDLDIGIDAKELWTVGYANECIGRAKAAGTGTDVGRRELLEGLQILLSFQEEFSPLVVPVTEEYLDTFRILMPSDLFFDVVDGRKQAIGALRHNASAYAERNRDEGRISLSGFCDR